MEADGEAAAPPGDDAAKASPPWSEDGPLEEDAAAGKQAGTADGAGDSGHEDSATQAAAAQAQKAQQASYCDLYKTRFVKSSLCLVGRADLIVLFVL